MAVNDAIAMVRNKAIKDISEAIYGRVDYCWQEETTDEARVSKISEILISLEADEKRIRAKYKKKQVKEGDTNGNGKSSQ